MSHDFKGQPGDEFKCENCGGNFRRQRTDSSALDEWKTADPHNEFTSGPADYAIVCDKCWVNIMRRAKAAGFPVPKTFEDRIGDA